MFGEKRTVLPITQTPLGERTHCTYTPFGESMVYITENDPTHQTHSPLQHL